MSRLKGGEERRRRKSSVLDIKATQEGCMAVGAWLPGPTLCQSHQPYLPPLSPQLSMEIHISNCHPLGDRRSLLQKNFHFLPVTKPQARHYVDEGKFVVPNKNSGL